MRTTQPNATRKIFTNDLSTTLNKYNFKFPVSFYSFYFFRFSFCFFVVLLKIILNWEKLPNKYVKLDHKSFLLANNAENRFDDLLNLQQQQQQKMRDNEIGKMNEKPVYNQSTSCKWDSNRDEREEEEEEDDSKAKKSRPLTLEEFMRNDICSFDHSPSTTTNNKLRRPLNADLGFFIGQPSQDRKSLLTTNSSSSTTFFKSSSKS